jgi:hypothetical protein
MAGWVLKRESGEYFAGFGRYGHYLQTRNQRFAIKFRSSELAWAVADIGEMRVVRLAPKKKPAVGSPSESTGEVEK